MVRATTLYQQDQGFESRKLDLPLGCWTYDKCNPSLRADEVYTRVSRPGEDHVKEHPKHFRRFPALISRRLRNCRGGDYAIEFQPGGTIFRARKMSREGGMHKLGSSLATSWMTFLQDIFEAVFLPSVDPPPPPGFLCRQPCQLSKLVNL